MGPIPGAPGILSTLSPVKACIWITFFGSTPNFSITSGMPIFLFFIGSSISTFSFTSCIKSLSDETISDEIFNLLARLE